MARTAPHGRLLQELDALVTGRRYLLLTTAATAIAAASTFQRLPQPSASSSFASVAALFFAELLTSRISTLVVLHCFLVVMYHAFLLLAHAALGSLRAVELQQTKETLIPFVLLRCQLLVSTMEPGAHDRAELGLLVVWLAALSVLRALLALTQARFQNLLTRPLTQLRDLQRLGAVLGGIAVLNVALAVTCSRLELFSDRITHVPWFEASLLLLKTLELGVQVGFQGLDVSAATSTDEGEDSGAGYSENSEFHLLLLQTVLSGCYLVQLVLYYLYVISVDQFRVSLFDLILILNVKNATVRLLEKIKHVKLYHQVVLDLDHLFPDASAAELEAVADDVCAICLKPMPVQAKKLQCGHLFHRLCLQQCLQRASVNDALAGLDTLTRMVNGLGMDGSLPPGAGVPGSSATGPTSLRCPICRKQVCGGKGDEPASRVHENHRQPEAEDVQDDPQQQPREDNVPGVPQAPERVVEPAAGAAESPNEGLRFNTAFMNRWLPSFSLEIARRRNFQVTEEMLQQIWEVFPQFTREQLQTDLVRTRSVERTMERILNGQLDEQQRENGGAEVGTAGALGEAWSFSALWNPPTPAPARARVVEDEAPRTNPQDADVDLQLQGQPELATESLLRRLERWRGQRPT